MECPFCHIDQNRVLNTGKHVLVMLSDPCLMPGHLLVLPRRHAEKISELNTSERQELWETAIEWQEKILKKLSSGCDICQHYRPFQEQDGVKVNHVHIHLRPRELYDELYELSQKHEKFDELSQEEATRISSTLLDR